MRKRIFNLTLILMMGSALVLCGRLEKARADGGYSGVWTTERPIVRKTKPNRVRTTPPPPKPGKKKVEVEKARLLTVQWRVLKKGMDGQEVEVDPAKPFYMGERVRFAIKVNQDGYLYIIQNTEGDEGETIFPDARISGGNNFVKRDDEIVIPSNCDEEHRDDCWFMMQPPAGHEAVTVIFSRDKITTLPNTAEEASALVKRHVVSSLQSTSPAPHYDKNPKSLGGGRFVTWATNMNPRDNEELVTTFYLTHEEKKSNNSQVFVGGIR